MKDGKAVLESALAANKLQLNLELEGVAYCVRVVQGRDLREALRHEVWLSFR